jgi:hypothetical protein
MKVKGRPKLLGKRGIKGKFWIVLNRSFDSIPDAWEVADTLEVSWNSIFTKSSPKLEMLVVNIPELKKGKIVIEG